MVVDSVVIFELKGPYCTLTMIDWFLQTLSVIPRDHGTMLLDALPWSDGGLTAILDLMVRKIVHVIIFSLGNCADRSNLIVDQDYDEVTTMYSKPMFPGPDLAPLPSSPPPLVVVVATRRRRRVVSRRRCLQIHSERLGMKIPFVKPSLVFQCRPVKELRFLLWTGLDDWSYSTVERLSPFVE
ncbi:putative LRR receptor-like serine/threonine-protein kinase [Dorcoceras hygrometricum]|uniref:Putative LRR receptor-like serine/threonine-protein kinase n=1 Tax=Dorcoceras hygrometricum TaxID=472368 RepID=A0A2Z7ARP3_9LAMI|nr:putative LRR receptor-like serine/threonine-protein kinase [Dorcoceras hygrometricum]